MIQLEKPVLPGTMPVVWPTVLDLGRDECKRILRKLELEAYAGVISALRAQGDLTKDKKDLLGELTKILGISTERHRAEVRRAVNDERLTTIAYHMSGPNSGSEWSIEGRRLVPLMPRLVPQTAFTVSANAIASATANQNATLLLPAQTGNKEVVVCYSYTSTTGTCSSASAAGAVMGAAMKSPRPPSPSSNVVVLPSGSTVYVKSVSCSDEDEKPRKRRRTNSSSSPPVVLKEVTKASPPVAKTLSSIGSMPVSSSPKMSNIMQSIANSLPPHLSPVKITFTKPSLQTTSATTQKVIIVTTSPSSSFVPNILSKSHGHSAVSKLCSTGVLTPPTHKQTVVFPASTIAVTSVVSSSPSVLMSTMAPSGGSAAVKLTSARLPSPKTLVGSPSQILAHLPKQQSPKQLQQGSPVGGAGMSQGTGGSPGSKPTIQIKQESGVKIITQQVTPSKILPKPSSVGLSSSSSSPIMVVSSNGAIMTTKLVTQPTATQTTYTRPTVGPSLGARLTASGAGATYVKTTSGSIITVVPKSLATLGGKIISSNIVSGTTTKITTIPMTSKPNVIVVQKTTGKGATIQGLPAKNVVTTLLNAGAEKSLQAVQGTKPAIITASRPITKMIVTQPKGLAAGATATKIIPTKIVYGQQGKTQVLIKPKPVFQAAVVSEQARQLVTETLQQASRSAEAGLQEARDEAFAETAAGLLSEAAPGSSTDAQVLHVVSSREADWTEQEVSVESSPTIIYQELTPGEAQSATSTIKALLELQQTTVKDKGESKLRQHTIDLSQMAVPLQLSQEKRGVPEPLRTPAPSSSFSSSISSTSSTISSTTSSSISSSTSSTISSTTSSTISSSISSTISSSISSSISSTGDAAAAELSSTGKAREDDPVPSPALPPGKAVKASPVSTATKPVPVSTSVSAAGPVGHTALDGGKSVLEVSEAEGDTLDPQTGLFYRSTETSDPPKPAQASTPKPAQAPAPKPTQAPAPKPAQAPALKPAQAPAPKPLQAPAPKPLQAPALKPAQAPALKPAQAPVLKPAQAPVLKPAQAPAPKPTQAPPPQLHSKPQLTPSTPPLAKKPPKLSSPQTPSSSHSPSTLTPTALTPSPSALAVPTQAGAKLTPQLPRLQHAPTSSLHRPPRSDLSHPPPLQAHHPVSADKTPPNQPIITQSATVTKITFGSALLPSAEASAKLLPEPSGGGAGPSAEKSVSDILKISMMQAEIDPCTEPMVVDSSSDCGPLAKALGPLGKSEAGPFISSSHTKGPQYSCLQSLAAQRSKEDMDVIEVIPQYSILPDSSQSSVVVEPSGFLEITNYTSQQLEEDSPMETEADSSNDEASPSGQP